MSSTETPSIKAITIIRNTIPTTAKPKASVIQRGEVTHHQDQSIFPVNLRTKNTMKRTADKLKPVPELLFDAIFYFNILVYTNFV